MARFVDLIKGVHPGIFVHSVYISEDQEEDKKAGFFGNLDNHLPLVYEQLNAVSELEGGFDAIGFSQGGQFLRAYVHLYNQPPMHNLITFGSQHMGVSELPACGTWDVFCLLLHRYARGRVYSDWAQTNLVPAQYFRDPARLPLYYKQNHWLPLVNNELPESRNETFRENFTSLNSLVLVLFSNDTTVVPKESGWFGSYAPTDDAAWTRADPPPIIPMREHPLYTEDWVGLKTLDERGAVVELTCEGPHMHIARACWEPLVEKYVGGEIAISTSKLPSLVVDQTSSGL
ncbi:hypothetical protein FRB90_007849 [Tulasnella sp. 427]|nr:hypothetical protein FRB90_007849 [Tulasnella sp. 427]